MKFINSPEYSYAVKVLTVTGETAKIKYLFDGYIDTVDLEDLSDRPEMEVRGLENNTKIPSDWLIGV